MQFTGLKYPCSVAFYQVKDLYVLFLQEVMIKTKSLQLKEDLNPKLSDHNQQVTPLLQGVCSAEIKQI